jgi:hypothetical protein
MAVNRRDSDPLGHSLKIEPLKPLPEPAKRGLGRPRLVPLLAALFVVAVLAGIAGWIGGGYSVAVFLIFIAFLPLSLVYQLVEDRLDLGHWHLAFWNGRPGEARDACVDPQSQYRSPK